MAQSVRILAEAEGLMLRDPQGRWHIGLGPFVRQAEEPIHQAAFFVGDFALREAQPWWIPSRWVQLNEADFSGPEQKPPELSWQEPELADFAADFRSFQEHLARGDLKKIVPVSEAKASAPNPPSPALRLHLLRRLLSASASFFPYALWTEEELWIGLSPEFLFLKNSEELLCLALAGTAAADAPSLLISPKERHEHACVIQDIQERLQPLTQNTVLGETQEVALGPLKHLRTEIRALGLSGLNWKLLLERLHPTAALGGWPREPAKRWLESRAWSAQRGRFGAPFGISRPGELSFAIVAIRNLLWKGGEWQLKSGCGLVAGSELGREWEELQLKRRSVLAGLGLG